MMPLASRAQYAIAVDGYVVDKINGEPIAGARVVCVTRGNETFTNRYGYYSLNVPAGVVELMVQYQGYTTQTIQLTDVDGNQSKLVSMIKSIPDWTLSDFEQQARDESLLIDPISSKIDVSVGTMKQIPYLFSENDVVKGLQMFPGVDFGVEGTSDLLVRGGNMGQNLMTIDGIPIYSQGHFLGYISNFNTGIVNNIQLYKGAFPARYGGRVSSVVDITSTSGSKNDVHGTLAVSPILANLQLGLPLDQKGNSMSINWRRSYIDVLLPGLVDQIKFGDFHSKMDLKLSDRDRLQLMYYSLNDGIGASFDSDDSTLNTSYELSLSEKNQTAIARWNHTYNNRLFSSVSAGYTGFVHSESLIEKNPTPQPGNPHRIETNVAFKMRDYILNADFDYNRNEKHLIRFGAQNTLHNFLPGQLEESRYDSIHRLLSSEIAGSSSFQSTVESAVYVEDEYNYGQNLRINAGLRAAVYAGGDLFGIYPEPRFSARYRIDSISSFKFGFTRMNQFLHLYNNGGSTADIIVWIPADKVLKPENSNQFTLGYVRNVKNNWQFQADAYYKTLGNQLLFYSIQYFDDPNYERNALVGKGDGYGIETMMRYSDKALTAQFSYNYAIANRTFDQLNRGEKFAYDFDRRHVLKANMISSFDQWVFSVNVVAASGNPYTLPNAKYRDLEGRVVLSYDEINNYRAKTYFRVDTKLQYFWGGYSDFNQCVELTIYNISGNENTSSIYTELDREQPGEKYIAQRESMFLFMPSISYKLTI